MKDTYTAEELSTLKGKITHGFSVLLLRETLLKIFAFAAQLFLARILSPSDFGFYAIIVFIINFLGLFSDIGLSSAIIRQETPPSKQQISNIFWFKTIINSILVVLLIIAAPFLHVIYPSLLPIHVQMIQIISVTLLFAAIRSTPIALLEKDLQYGPISIIDIIGIFLYYIVAIILAMRNFGVWSFILATVAKEIIETIIVFLYKPLQIIFTFNVKNLRQLIKFGLFIQAGGFVTFLNSALIPVIGGISSTPYNVGLLDWASTLALTPSNAITNNFGRVAFAGFSKVQQDKILLRKSIEKSTAILSLVLFILPVGIFGFGKQITTFLYTSKWEAGLPALYWFAITIFFSSVTATYGQGILVLGKSKQIFYATLVSNIAGILLAIFLLIPFGFTGIAIASFLANFLLFFLYIIIAKKIALDANLISAIIPKLWIAFLTSFWIFVINASISDTFILFIIKGISAVSVYGILSFVFAKKDIQDIFTMVKTIAIK
ncbi:MAG TPA: oligosaccharide flippase family protein [Patescibacteria group bacterium]